jgi:UPF0176 protein
MKIKNIAFYTFFKPSFKLEDAQAALREQMRALNIKGTILLADEGLNCSLSGATEEMDTFLARLIEITGIKNPELKISYSDIIPFKRSLVKIKDHIVAEPGKTHIDPTKDASLAPYISPQMLHQWIKDNKKMVLLDTRNDYEYEAGRFKNSLHLGTKHFAHFEKDLQQAPKEWQHTPIVTFCTGGIRCEKAAPLMVKKGFQEVYQLEGGILNYFKENGQGFFEGDCFVFDERRTQSPG